jgi:hypothetical protein
VGGAGLVVAGRMSTIYPCTRLRASVGLVTTFADVYRYVRFAETFIDRTIAG